MHTPAPRRTVATTSVSSGSASSTTQSPVLYEYCRVWTLGLLDDIRWKQGQHRVSDESQQRKHPVLDAARSFPFAYWDGSDGDEEELHESAGLFRAVSPPCLLSLDALGVFSLRIPEHVVFRNGDELHGRKTDELHLSLLSWHGQSFDPCPQRLETTCSLLDRHGEAFPWNECPRNAS